MEELLIVSSDGFAGKLSQSVSLVSTDAFFSQDFCGNHVLVVPLHLVDEFICQK